ncbi:MAG: AMP-binding protein [Nitrospirae bacterium]|nr:AMP-binding protein [Candidatus Manganitrophaceae bacterium]
MATQRSTDLKLLVEQKVLGVLREFLGEMGMDRAGRALSPDASLDRDLGLGSLERVELLLRIEKAFAVKIPEQLIAEARTVRDLAAAVLQAESPDRPVSSAPLPVLSEATPPPASAATLMEVLLIRAQREPDRPHLYLPQESGEEEALTYRQLLTSAGTIAQGLLEKGLRRGDPVAVMLPTGIDFFSTFFGVLLAGGIPVPLYPPYRIDQIEEYARRQVAILRKAEARFLITSNQVEGLARLLSPLVPSLSGILNAGAFAPSTDAPPAPALQADDPGLIQFTSGSTGTPKGVLLAHRNILANIRAIGAAAEIGPTDVGVSWLPLYHDMGLIGSWLCCLYYGIPITILSPLTFLTRPERWLWAIHYHRGTLSAAPNFAYELCVRKIDPRAIDGLDLSSWRVAFNGAEPINPDTLARFTERFSSYGFRKETFFPVYGMAESSVALTFPKVGRPPRIDVIARETFERMRRAEPASPSEKTPLRFVSCGVPLPGHAVRIVDAEGAEVGERQEGSLQFRGPSTMVGYYRDLEATAATFVDGWCDSGDLAYRADGELFITGRRKDIIIKAGRNLYPQEVEGVVGEIPGIRRGCVAAFGAPDPEIGTERLAVVAETREEDEAAKERLIGEIIEKVAAATDVRPDHVLLVPPGTLPKTSSGKLRRSTLRDAYLKGEVVRRRDAPLLQITRLWMAGASIRLKRSAGTAGQLLYAGYIGLLLLLTLVPTWLAMSVLPGGRIAAALARRWSRLFLALAGCRLTVDGSEHLAAGPQLFVANHASYLDAVVMMAALPPRFLFMAKQELTRMPIVRTFIKKVGHLTVDRLDPAEGTGSLRRMEAALRGGHSLLVFPEATFSKVRGIRPFRLGAFKLAVQNGIPICPVAIRGSREILWPGRRLPRPGRLQTIIGRPIAPKGKEWREVIRLKEEVKLEISRQAGEPAIDLVAAEIAPE